ncbi:Ig-like domain-containing protein [Neobacillus drentensis]|uniref:Ig-like domain-containing protein n=1 Tax=Neobacillus drentensis TaxID=220684 RepID=UPI00285F0B54|nr:Ig-like domain-containing protein [Neobacillus drentensis]MDR7239595.1 secreted PhoX family phosphatase/ribosomal protein S19 [Neobacillus drentensis]
MNKKRLGKKGTAFALTLALTIPALTPAAAASNSQVKIDSVKFNGMASPTTIDQMVKTYSTASVDVKYSNGKVKTFPLSYKRLFKSEDKIAINNGELIPAGTPIDYYGDPIMDNSVPGSPKPFVSDAPDSNSLLRPINGNLYMVTHYEYQTLDAAGNSAYGIVPASMSLTTLDQDKKTGELKAKAVKKIDFSDVNGLWIPCNGSLSPWNTHLGSEEYEPDARSFELDANSSARTSVESFAQLYFGDKSKANPYFYGYIPEIQVKKSGKVKVEKHYNLGRFSHELMKMMPDNRTAYFGDDGTNTTMFMYVADRAEDLSAGTLYAAKFVQTGKENGGSGNLEWIKLGHSNDREVKAIIDNGTKFSDIFETSDVPQEGFKAIKQYSYGKTEYVKLKPGMEKAAAFLESRRYAAYLGATSEFNKMEGVTFNAKDKKVYIAIADQSSSMEKDSTGTAPADDIQLPKIKSGVTYQLDLNGSQKDNNGHGILSKYVATSMSGLLVGEDMPTADAYGNTANVDKVASPDNLSYSEEMRTLFIGEDSSKHTNNYVWAYNVDTKELTRILSNPAGAESTGLLATGDRNGFSYIMSNFQHPGDELDTKAITAVNKEDLKKAMEAEIGINKTGGVGYIAGLPSFTNMPDFTAPAAPIINQVTDQSTSVTGKAEANATAKLYVNGKYQKSITVDKNGHYKFAIAKQRAATEIKVTVTDEAGNVSTAKSIKVVDKTAPVKPSVSKVTYKSTIVTGKAEIGSTVYVYNGKKFVSKAVADTKGNYKIKIKTQKKRTTLTIFALDKAGNKSSSVTIKVN